MNFAPRDPANAKSSMREFESALSIERLHLSLLLYSLDTTSSRTCMTLKGPLAHRVRAIAESDGWSSPQVNYC